MAKPDQRSLLRPRNSRALPALVFSVSNWSSVLESAQQLREDLLTTQRLFDPKGTADPSHHVVVIAHSMGGILAHTLVSDSADALWNSFANKPFHGLSLHPEEKKLISELFSSGINPLSIASFFSQYHTAVVACSGALGTIGNRIIRRPKVVAETIRELIADDPGVVRPYFARLSAQSVPTSLISLAPNPLLDGLAALPIRVPFHSIIGDRGLGGGMHSSDGVVPYRSSHLAGAESEKIVPAGHAVFSNEAAVIEIKRILEKNLTRSSHR